MEYTLPQRQQLSIAEHILKSIFIHQPTELELTVDLGLVTVVVEHYFEAEAVEDEDADEIVMEETEVSTLITLSIQDDSQSFSTKTVITFHEYADFQQWFSTLPVLMHG